MSGGAPAGGGPGPGRGAGAEGGVTWDDLVALGLRLPGVVLGTAYGTPALRVGGPKGKLVARLREDGESAAVPCAPEEKAPLLAMHPGRLFTTPHYDRSAYVCLRLGPGLWPVLAAELLEDAWALRAPAKAVRELRAGRLRGGVGWDDAGGAAAGGAAAGAEGGP